MRVALAPINPTVGDIEGNARLIIDAIEQARAASADLVVLPELALCGYPPKDLLLQHGFIEACGEAAKRIGQSATRGITAVFGLPLPPDSRNPRGPIANSLVVFRGGRFIDFYDKRLLPTYDVFDEDRYFTPGQRAVVVEVPTKSAGVMNVGLCVCEDMWKGEDAGFASRYLNGADPVAEVVRAGAKVIISPSASPFVLGKSERHREILSRHAAGHRVHVVSVNQLGGNDELVFDGHALVFGPDGTLAAGNDEFGTGLCVHDLGSVGWSMTAGSNGGTRSDAASDERSLYFALRIGIRDYLRKTGFTSAIIGLSGGIDSALTAALAAAAIGPKNVLGVAMPGPYSSEHSLSDAKELARRIGMTFITQPIGEPLNGFRNVLDSGFASLDEARLGEAMPDITEENIQSRIRGSILMALSNRTGAMVLTTGNKSELAVGYCTLYGDMNGGLAVLSDVTKQSVYKLSRWLNANHVEAGFDVPPIPDSSIEKPPSAELRHNQTDQDSLPPYDLLDEIIRRRVEGHQSVEEIIRESGINPDVVRKMVRLMDVSEYKRKQAALGLKVTGVAFGSGRRMPVAQGWRG